MNDCEKYQEWMTDAALGALQAERELLAHAAECQACGEAYRKARELAAFVDRGVESLVAGEASPYFASRLRTRIAGERAPASFAWLGWKPIAVGLLVAAFTGVLVVSRRPLRQDPEPVPVRAEVGASSNPTRNVQVRRDYRGSGAGEATVIQPVLRRSDAGRQAILQQPEVLVPPGQIDAILQFARAVRSGEIDGQQLLAAQEEAEKPLEIAPIEIAPLAPLQPEVASNTPDDGRK
jgi:hypothetical protein